MNDLFQNFGDQLKGSSGGTKILAVIVCLAMVVVIGGAAVVMNGPDFQLTFSGLSDHDFPKVTKALADSGVAFRTSQPPGPFSVFVDADDRTAAYRAVYSAGALDKPLRGIMAQGGMSSVFASSEERKQGVRKREWGEMEKMLEDLDFVQSATVRTFERNDSSVPNKNAPPRTASVTLRIAENATLMRGQSDTVANLVSRGLGISKENLVISDQLGQNLYDGTASNAEELHIQDLLSHQSKYDARMTEVANLVLQDVLGPRKARVTVTSEWDYAQTTKSKEESLGTGALLMESKLKTDRTVPAGTGSEPVGVSSNTITPNASASTDPAQTAEPMTETTSDEKTEYQPTISREDTVDYVPRLDRLSIALFLDQSLTSEEVKLEDLEEAIKAAVGFTDGRDEYRSVVFPFAGGAAVATGVEGADAVPSAPNPLIEKVLRYGLEIGTGLIFLTLLLRSLRRSSAPEVQPVGRPAAGGANAGALGAGGMGAAAGAGLGAGGEELDAEQLAQLEIEQLLNSDPAKLGETLSQWVQEDEPVEASR